jgi:DNA-binding Lrp family transcriptional regulator
MATGFVLINIELGEERKILRELRAMSNIKEAHFVYGPHDIIARIEADNIPKLKDVVSSKIRRLTDVTGAFLHLDRCEWDL